MPEPHALEPKRAGAAVQRMSRHKKGTMIRDSAREVFNYYGVKEVAPSRRDKHSIKALPSGSVGPSK